MTIIVGTLCQDGVIIAADGLASNNLSNNTPFVGIENLKVEEIKNTIIACAGHDYLMTLFINYMQTEFSRPSHCSNSDEVACLLIKGFQGYWHRLYIAPLLHNSKIQIINKSPVLEDPIKNQQVCSEFQKINEGFEAMFAFEFNNQHFLYTVYGLNQPTMLRENGMWYTILGSGYFTGLPSIHLIKKVLNIQEKPSIEKGIQLTYWTIKHAIEVTSGGIGGKITLIKLGKTSTGYKIEKVDTTGTEEYITSIYDHIYSFVCEIKNSEHAPAFISST
jgi:hypothetical protein